MGRTALSYAIENLSGEKSLSVIRLLLRRGASVDRSVYEALGALPPALAERKACFELFMAQGISLESIFSRASLDGKVIEELERRTNLVSRGGVLTKLIMLNDFTVNPTPVLDPAVRALMDQHNARLAPTLPELPRSHTPPLPSSILARAVSSRGASGAPPLLTSVSPFSSLGLPSGSASPISFGLGGGGLLFPILFTPRPPIAPSGSRPLHSSPLAARSALVAAPGGGSPEAGSMPSSATATPSPGLTPTP